MTDVFDDVRKGDTVRITFKEDVVTSVNTQEIMTEKWWWRVENVHSVEIVQRKALEVNDEVTTIEEAQKLPVFAVIKRDGAQFPMVKGSDKRWYIPGHADPFSPILPSRIILLPES